MTVRVYQGQATNLSSLRRLKKRTQHPRGQRDCLRTETSHSSRGLTARRTVAGWMGGEAGGVRAQRTPSRGGLRGKEMRWEEQPDRDPRRAATLQSAQGPREVAALAAAAPPGRATTPRRMARKPLLLAGPAGDITKRNPVGGGPWVTFSLRHSIFSLGRDF